MSWMLRFLVKHTPKRLTRGVPVLALLSAAEVAVIARTHLRKLDGAQRRRLLELLRKAHGRPGALAKDERDELAAIVALLEPRVFLGSAADKLSPVPVPKRLLYGAKRPASGDAG
jgi:hypothetical protein